MARKFSNDWKKKERPRSAIADTAGKWIVFLYPGSLTQIFFYSYLPNSDLIGQNSNFQYQVSRIYEPDRNLIVSIQNRSGVVLVSQFDYENDAVGRRTLRVDTLSTTNVFGYNIRSELTEATMGTNVFGYVYDSIGNRRWATNNAAVTEYLANELNQYTNILEGAASSAPEYDADGNMISCGAWTFEWDAENRLIVASNGATVVQNAYDYMSRRVSKTTPTATSEFLYDGWNMIREQVPDNGSLVTNSYVWGLDLSGTLQNAGGIGGLLLRCCHGAPSPCFYAYDANGNVTELVDTNGSVVAHYEYDPYGDEISRGGAEAQSNPYRFSTKYADDETGLLYYGFRFYSAQLGRWISRDPLGECLGIFIGAAPLPVQRLVHNIVRERVIKQWSLSDADASAMFKGLDLLSDISMGDLVQQMADFASHSFQFVRNSPIQSIDPYGLSSCASWRKLKKWCATDPGLVGNCAACCGEQFVFCVATAGSIWGKVNCYMKRLTCLGACAASGGNDGPGIFP